MIEKWKLVVKGNLRQNVRFWNHYLKILKFLLTLLTSSTQKWVKQIKNGISCTNVDRKMKIKSEKLFHVDYSLMKPLSQNVEILTQQEDIINSISAWTRVQTRISCTNDDKKMKIKNKRNFEVSYLFMKLFPRNLEILGPCSDNIISKLGQKSQIFISCSYKFRS